MNDEQMMLIQGMVDRLLYLSGKDKDEFLKYIDALYEVYPIPRKILYGRDALMNDKNNEDGE